MRFALLALVCGLLALTSGAHAAALTLTWDAPTDSGVPTTYTLYRNQAGGAMTPLGQVAHPTVVYTDATPPTSGKYCYEVTATYAALGESPASNRLCFSAPAPPLNLRSVSP